MTLVGGIRRVPLLALIAACTREPARAGGPVIVPIGASSAAPIVSSAPAREDASSGEGFLVEGERVSTVTREAAMDVIRRSADRAVARAFLSTPDCSSRGAHHLLFTLETRSDGSVGKRAYLRSGGLVGFPFRLGVRDGDAGGVSTGFAGSTTIDVAASLVDGWFLVGLDPRGGRATITAPCVNGEWYDARVTALVPVEDAAEGARLLRAGR